MPEGDTIHRAARTIERAIGGNVVRDSRPLSPRSSRADDQQPVVGRRIESVTARGKNLIIGFSGDLYLRSHLRMNGSWHIYRPGERWQRSRDDMRVVIGTEDFLIVGFSLPVAEFHDARSLERTPDLQRLGPDLVDEEFDAFEALRRMRRYPERDIAEVLLNQTALAGIGNIYKSEVLFICGVSPFARAGGIADDVLGRIVATARKLLRHNVNRESSARETLSTLRRGRRLWVYGRAGEPCRKCGTPIEYRKQGTDVRGTYWCPKCQGETGMGHGA